MERKIFIFNKDCVLVEGAKRGALYNLRDGNVYSINKNSLRLLQLCSKYSIARLEQLINIPKKEIIQYLNQLEKLGMGKFKDKRESMHKAFQNPNNKRKVMLNFIWLELTEGCNLQCLHCYSNSNPSKISKRSSQIKIIGWKNIIKEAHDLGCKSIQFIGGEPFIIANELFLLIKFAQKKGYKFIEIFTNGVNLDSKHIDILKELKVSLAISIYGHNTEVHDQITRTKGSFKRTINNIRMLKEEGIPLRIAIVVMKQNQDYLDALIKFLNKELKINNIRYDLIRPSGRGLDRILVPDKLIKAHGIRRPKFPPIHKETFLLRQNGHNCFLLKICIGSNGDVYPCIMERDFILGNIKNSSLRDILSNSVAQYIQSLGKDNIDVCQDCEYRYACFDCRVKAKGGDPERIHAKPKECTYDPYRGVWQP